jgi:hypothetical protein
VAGTYQSSSGQWDEGNVPFLQGPPGPKTLTIERLRDDNARVRITYQRAGKTVVETWTSDSVFPSEDWRNERCPPRFATSLDFASADFGEVPVGAERRFVFTYRNDGEAVTGTPSVTVTGPDFAISPATTCGALSPQGSCQISVQFRPLGPGRRIGSLVVIATPGGTVTAELSGVGVVPDAAPEGPPDAAADMDAQPPGAEASGE